MRQPQGLELYPRMPVTGMRPKGAAVAGVAPGDKSERPARPQELKAGAYRMLRQNIAVEIRRDGGALLG